MPVVYCDAEGKPVQVGDRTGAEPRRPPADTAFAFIVGVDEATAAAIDKAPADWRFAGPNPADGRHMRRLKDFPTRDRAAHEATFQQTSREFAAYVASKRERARQEAELAAMLSGARPVAT